MSSPTSSDEYLQRFLALHPKSIDLTLDRIVRLLAALDHPEKKMPPVIHVAGTNGKGSAVAYLRAMLEAAGYKVHAYTSPHLVHFNERIALAGLDGRARPIGEQELVGLLEHVSRVNGDEPITFFEITTAAAFLAFAETPADAVILEVGLGGRLDAAPPAVAPPTTFRAALARALGRDGRPAADNAGRCGGQLRHSTSDAATGSPPLGARHARLC